MVTQPLWDTRNITRTDALTHAHTQTHNAHLQSEEYTSQKYVLFIIVPTKSVGGSSIGFTRPS